MATLKIFNDGKRITAALSGDIDHHAARQLREELDGIIERSQPELLILDLEDVGFMDSSGIGLILGRMKSLRALGGELLIKNARPEIAEVIGLSGLSAILVKRRTDKPRISVLSGNSGKSGKTDNSVNSGYSGISDKAGSGKPVNSCKPDKSVNSENTDKSRKSNKSANSGKQGKSENRDKSSKSSNSSNSSNTSNTAKLSKIGTKE